MSCNSNRNTVKPEKAGIFCGNPSIPPFLYSCTFLTSVPTVPELDVTKSHSKITKIEKSVSLKFPRSTTFGCKDIGIGKLEFEARTQFRWVKLIPGFMKSDRTYKNKRTIIDYYSISKLDWKPNLVGKLNSLYKSQPLIKKFKTIR